MTTAPRNTVLVGDALLRLRALPPDSVDSIVTSPPYFALRDYGVAGQLGQERDVQAWVQNLRLVLRVAQRVLRPHGTLWLNLGDSYSRGARWGAPDKSLLLGPERLLLALSQDGWIVRNKIVWAKTNAIPSSVRDRLATKWEPIYLLTKTGRYYFDLDAIRQPHRSAVAASKSLADVPHREAWQGALANNRRGLRQMRAAGSVGHPLGKNPGDVWQVAASQYRGPHFATFPPALITPAIDAGCAAWTCSRCHLPWQRDRYVHQLGRLAVRGDFSPACHCQASRLPGLVLDPFLGAGTVAVVAERLGRDWLGIELNPAYAALARARVAEHLRNRQEELHDA